MATFLNSSVSNQLISLASRDKTMLDNNNSSSSSVSNQLISLASRESGDQVTPKRGDDVSNQLISLASRERELLCFYLLCGHYF